MKKFWISIFIIPNLRSAAAYLRSRDENSTGADDEAAEAIEHAVGRLEKWAAMPDEPKP
jgi:ABC-type cobalt transport system substrate-binding protein